MKSKYETILAVQNYHSTLFAPKRIISQQMNFKIAALAKETGIDKATLCSIYKTSQEHYYKIDKLRDYFNDQLLKLNNYDLTVEKTNLYSISQVKYLKSVSWNIKYGYEQFPEPELDASRPSVN